MGWEFMDLGFRLTVGAEGLGSLRFGAYRLRFGAYSRALRASRTTNMRAWGTIAKNQIEEQVEDELKVGFLHGL